MRLRIQNESRFLGTDVVRKAAHYYISRLTGERYPDIDLTLQFTDGLKDYAYCEWIGDSSRPKKFKIAMNPNLGAKRTLEVLAHEMVHVKQYTKRELKDYVNSNHVKWHGVKMHYDEQNYEQYFESPWEIEAYGRQVGLYNGFKLEYLNGRDPQ